MSLDEWIGDDDAEGRVPSLDIGLGDEPDITLGYPQSLISRVSAAIALMEAVKVAAYEYHRMVSFRSDVRAKRIGELRDEGEKLADEIEERESELDSADPGFDCCFEPVRKRDKPVEYIPRCAECRGQDDCTGTCPCVTEWLASERASLAQDREKQAALESELEREQADLEADEELALQVAGKVAEFLVVGKEAVGGESVTSPVTPRLCACGCGQPITSPRPEARYATGACRVRAHRAR